MTEAVIAVEDVKDKRKYFLERLPIVQDIKLREKMSVSDLIEELGKSGGFTAKKLHEAAKILCDMLLDDDSVNFLSFPAAILATGTRGIIKEFVKRKFFDIIITTCGSIDHDIARCWREYYHGWFEADDKELADLEIHRLGNIFIPYENYGGIIEEITQNFLNSLYESGMRELSTCELINHLGKYLDSCNKKEESIIWWAWKNGIKIFVPGITDGAFGYQLWLFKQEHKDFRIDVFLDETILDEIIYGAKRTGALIIGGGISKHHVIWWNQFKDGLERAVYITTAVEWDGSLSGARTREAISWGKISRKASHITVEGEATILLPLLGAYLIDKVGYRRINQ